MESKINVSVRMKPLSEAERASDKNYIWNQVSENTIMNVKTKEMFTFDNIFGERMQTQQIFDSQIKELVISAMQGFNVTAFAYGQTSSGKTYTMRGYNDNDPGLIPLSIQQIFDYIGGDKERKYDINVSYLEVREIFNGKVL
jgi:centromeric protein E